MLLHGHLTGPFKSLGVWSTYIVFGTEKHVLMACPPSSLVPGPGNLSQHGQKPTPHMTSLTENPKLKTKNFFSMQTC